ncbi:helix-turn-helix domain-containing protein [Natrinema sp. H-ect4]|uniref:helix-turn-helix domain-containing protein n=1 Tax=Natrinema sp. H-ect4 TaxID=3242699 RepID=UPI0035A96D29
MTQDGDWEELGRQLRKARKYRGYSQEEIADYLNASRSYIALVENGQKKIDSDQLQSLADLYNTTTDELTGDLEAKTGENRQIDLLARASQDLADEDKEEVLRFAKFLKGWPSEGRE